MEPVLALPAAAELSPSAVPAYSSSPVASNTDALGTLEDQLRRDWDDVNTKLMQAPHPMKVDPDLLADMLRVLTIK